MALQDLPVVLCLDRGGIVGEDGATHHGCYDMSIYRPIPGAVIAVPKDELELKNMMYSAMLSEHGPYIIRYPRGYGEGAQWQDAPYEEMEAGRGELMVKGSKVAVIAAGPSAYRAAEAAVEVESETGWKPSIYNIRYIKPIDQELLSGIAKEYDSIITVEDGTVLGGLFGAVAEFMASRGYNMPIHPIGIPDRYLSQGTQTELWEECGLTAGEIKKVILQKNEKK